MNSGPWAETWTGFWGGGGKRGPYVTRPDSMGVPLLNHSSQSPSISSYDCFVHLLFYDCLLWFVRFQYVKTSPFQQNMPEILAMGQAGFCLFYDFCCDLLCLCLLNFSLFQGDKKGKENLGLSKDQDGLG